MSAATPVSRVRPTPDGASTREVECAACGLVLRQLDDFDPDVALGTFLQHHPGSVEAIHRTDLPAGWSPVPAA